MATAADFDEKYGKMAREEYGHCKSAYKLSAALATRRPPIVATQGMLKVWFQNLSRPAEAIQVSSQEELMRVCGAYLHVLAAENPSDFSLQRALTRRRALKPS